RNPFDAPLIRETSLRVAIGGSWMAADERSDARVRRATAARQSQLRPTTDSTRLAPLRWLEHYRLPRHRWCYWGPTSFSSRARRRDKSSPLASTTTGIRHATHGPAGPPAEAFGDASWRDNRPRGPQAYAQRGGVAVCGVPPGAGLAKRAGRRILHRSRSEEHTS